MPYQQKFIDDVCVLEIKQDISSRDEAISIKNYITEYVSSKVTRLVIDCSSIDYIDSAFLGAMVFALRKNFSPNIVVKFVRSDYNDQVWSMFEINIVSEFYNVYTNMEEALESFTYNLGSNELQYSEVI